MTVSPATNITTTSSSSLRRKLPIVLVPPFYKFHPDDAYERYTVCVDESVDGCEVGVNKIEWVGSEVVDPAPYQFRYHDSGPASLQGVFMLTDQYAGNSFLVSLAKTRQAPGGISTGETGKRDKLGYTMVIRPRGDHNWAFSFPDQNLFATSRGADILDTVYRFQMYEGTSW